MEVIKLYELGKKAKNGDNDAMLEILKIKRGIIRKYSEGDEDCYQTIILNIIKGIKKCKF